MRPTTIYAPHGKDGHDDHMVTSRLARLAVQRIHERDGNYDPLVRMYEVWTPIEHPQHFENITRVMPLKLEALSKHVSQVRQIDYIAAIKGLNQYRACMQGTFVGIGHGYAECYEEWRP